MRKKNFTLKKTKHEETNFELQVTALIDTLVILLIFMLKTTALESLEIDTENNLIMPMVHDGITELSPAARLSISKEGLFWNGEQYIVSENFVISNENQWQQLAGAIKNTAEIKTENKGKKVYLQADKDTPYPVLDRALRLARQHGFKDVRFVAARYN